jgi:SPP1 gp7 family putative phage head morphogenesis protein
VADRAPATPARFKEASDWFRTRLPVTRDQWDGMRVAARSQAFTIAGTQQLDVVQAVMDSLQSAIDKGTPIDKWRADVRESLAKKFGAAADIKPSTLDTAFINANQHAYNAGRFEQMNSPDVAKALPMRRYDSVLDGRTSDACKTCAGTILPHDHPWWQTHWPPLHHRCRSTVRALTERMANRKGGVSKSAPNPGITGDFGLAPNIAPSWQPDLSKYEPNAASEYTRKQQLMQERALKRERKRVRRKSRD